MGRPGARGGLVNLAQLRALRAVNAAGSVTGAAGMLNITQSAVSHALASLEGELDLRLIIRDRAGCSLTEAGRSLLPHALEALDHIDRLAEKANSIAGPVAGTLRLGSLPSTCRLLRPTIRTFRRIWPAVEVVVFEGTGDEIVEWIARDVVELGVVTETGQGLWTVNLTEDEMLAVLSADHPLAEQPSLKLTELAEHQFLLYSASERAVRRLYTAQDLALSPAHRVWKASTLLAMIREGLGVSVVSSLTLEDAAGDGVVTRPLCPAESRRLWLGARATGDLGPVGKAFLSHLESHPLASRAEVLFIGVHEFLACNGGQWRAVSRPGETSTLAAGRRCR